MDVRLAGEGIRQSQGENVKLDAGKINLLRLVLRHADANGWAKVSAMVWPLVISLPRDLVETSPTGDGGYVRLTDSGKAVVLYS